MVLFSLTEGSISIQHRVFAANPAGPVIERWLEPIGTDENGNPLYFQLWALGSYTFFMEVPKGVLAPQADIQLEINTSFNG